MHTGEWMLLNSWVYEIHTRDDYMNVVKELMEKCARFLKTPQAFYARLDPSDPDRFLETVSLTAALCPHCPEDIPEVRELLITRTSCVYQSADLRDESLKGADPCAYIILAQDGVLYGIFGFQRPETDFSRDEMLLLSALQDHLAYRACVYEHTLEQPPTLSVEQVAEQYGLTRQEKRILDMTMQRMSNAEIAQTLSISMNTLKKHILNIYRKLNISSRLQLFRLIKGTN